MKQGHTDGPLERIFGIHPVLELLQSRRRQVDRIFVSRDRKGGLGEILRIARESGIPITHLSPELLGRKLGRRALHQGVAAQVSPIQFADADTIVERAVRRAAGLIVLADRVVDPGNLGAIVRTAAAAGADGIVLAGDGSSGLTPTVAKASAGAIERVPIARVSKPARWVEALKTRGFRALVLDPRGPLGWDEAKLTGPILIVAGGESRGARPGLAQVCDEKVAIPMAAGMDSLNVAISLGVLLFEAVRQRRGAAAGKEDSS